MWCPWLRKNRVQYALSVCFEFVPSTTKSDGGKYHTPRVAITIHWRTTKTTDW
jgi:hypothetical protein